MMSRQSCCINAFRAREAIDMAENRMTPSDLKYAGDMPGMSMLGDFGKSSSLHIACAWPRRPAMASRVLIGTIGRPCFDLLLMMV